MERSKRLSIAAVFTVFMYLIMLSQPLFGSAIDNYGAAMMIGQCFGADSVFVHISAGYCKLLGFLSGLLPRASLFMLAERFFVLLGMFALSDLILEKAKNVLEAVGLHLALVGLYGLMHLYNANYTVWTGFFLFVGWMLLANEQRSEKKRWGRRIFGYLFFFAGCVLRIQAVAQMLPFICLDVLLRAWDGHFSGFGKRIKKAVLLMLPAVLLVAAAGAEIYCVYLKGDYASEYAYNAARISVVDYPTKDYAELENPTFSENDYACVTNWVLMDTDIVTTEYLENMHDTAAEESAFSVPEMMARVKDMYFSTRDHIPLFLLVAAMVIFLFVQEGCVQKLRSGLAVLGAAMILAYLCYRGRLPDRVVYLLCLGILGNVLSSVLNDDLKGPNVMRWLAGFAAVCVFVCAGWIVLRDAEEMQSAFDAKAVTTSEEAGDTVIIWDMMYCSTDSPLTTPYDENPARLPDYGITNHNTSTGDVSSGQKSYFDQLSRMGIQNPMRALIERENTYFAASELNANRVLIWLQEHYDASTTMAQVDTSGNTAIWQYQTGE